MNSPQSARRNQEVNLNLFANVFPKEINSQQYFPDVNALANGDSDVKLIKKESGSMGAGKIALIVIAVVGLFYFGSKKLEW